MNAIAFLDEPDPHLQAHALKALNNKVDELWSPASLKLAEIEQLYEDQSFPQRELAALVASKIYYHLAAYPDSLLYALNSGSLFDVADTSDYVGCVVGKCLDKYIRQRQTGETPDPALETMFTNVLTNWTQKKSSSQLREVIGVTIDARRLDLLEKCLHQCLQLEDGRSFLKYCLDISNQHIYDREFRQSVLKLLAGLFTSDKLGSPDYINSMHCLILLNDPASVANIILSLIQAKVTESDELAFHIGFELYSNSTPFFNKAIIDTLLESEHKDLPSVVKLTQILSGKSTSELHLQFLYSQNKADISILTNIKKTIESRSSVLSNALVISNSLMYCGTSVDQFLRDNLEWLGKSSNWAKFTATASLGLIHRGHVKKSLDLLSPYLTSTGGSSPYQEGGALYALGLIHSPVCHDNPVSGDTQNDNQGQREIIKYLLDSIRNAGQNDQLLHGACLGLGLSAMTLADETIYSQLKDLLNMDSAVVGEAAALGIGMVMLGSANQEICHELIQYGQETQHEKITRGIAVALSLIMYNREDEADTVIEALCSHKDAIFRCGGAFVIGMAYAGSANPNAIEKLLNMAVTDVADEVRRNAIAYLGFLTFKKPKYCIDLVRLLSDSYNPQTRYGVAMAIGIACAGTQLKDAIEILERLQKDSVDYIRQMAYMSLSMVLIQAPKDHEKVTNLRKVLDDRIKDKHEDLMTKFGCILATGILDAGGRNVVIALHRNYHNLMKSIVGMAVFTQYWHWYSYFLLLSLTFHPVTEQCEAEEYKQPIHKWTVKDTPIGGAGLEGDEDQEPGPPEPFEWP